ncbi:MAG TPA: hypothetical protein VJ717_03505 [Gemmatimonadaceae bacterium]|nr:hypothetical protein [Gemmatimonadaceae bacterium]
MGAALVLTVACGNQATESPSPNDFADGLVATVSNVTAAGWPHDQLTIDSATTNRDTLLLHVQYGGGCRTHRFALLIGSAFMESQPVQVHARVAHDAGGDMCKALLAKTLTFDLTPLKTRYHASYGGGAATIVINFVGQSVSVRYSFD